MLSTHLRRIAGLAGLALLVGALLAPSAAFAFTSPNKPSSSDLVEQPAKWDGAPVTFTGEAIGEAMVRGEWAWLHLNDDAYMYMNTTEGAPLRGYNSGMPVWLAADLARTVNVFGDYRHDGDVVRIEGIFNAACAEHGGDMDIHAGSLEMVVPGRRAPDPTHPRQYGVAVLASLGAAVMWSANRRVGKSETRGFVGTR